MNKVVLPAMIDEYLTVFAPRTRKRSATTARTISLFDYVPWDEDRIMRTIVNELGWKRSRESEVDWRSDCKLAILKNQMYIETMGFSRNDILVCAMVRQGLLGRDEAVRRLEEENRKRPEIISLLCTEISGVPVNGNWKRV
jgi:hypothetical protein